MVPTLVRIITAAISLTAFLARPLPQNHVTQYRDQFRRENDPVRKAKLMPRLGDAEFEVIRSDTEAGEYDTALQLLENYRDEVVSTQKALEAKGIDPEKKPAGFKELQISVRESLHRLSEILADMTADQQASFEKVRKELELINRSLVRHLFPRQPGSSPEEDKPKS
jgi:hypothetical protein